MTHPFQNWLRLYQRLFLALTLLISVQSLPARAQAPAYEGWRLPLPAGQWTISRGPCRGEGTFDHPCGYYEDDCALDLVPADGSDITHTPVLAPQAGVIVFLGRRADAGIAAMIEHADGRVSALFHLSRTVVALGQAVARGDVIGYAGSTGTAKAHLHFHVQKNIVERECVSLAGLDAIDEREARGLSRNRPAREVALIQPPQALLDRWPFSVTNFRALVDTRLTLPISETVNIRVKLEGALSGLSTVYVRDGTRAQRVSVSAREVIIPIPAGTRTGEGGLAVFRDAALLQLAFQLKFTLARPTDNSSSEGVVLINPEFVSPASYSTWRSTPPLCWRTSPVVKTPVQFRVRVVGPQPADSGWTTSTCWQPPALPNGTYLWKVFVRDGDGYMNRTNQRPYAFVIR
jgi:murein DD-endopeptidase MepM/ murein hydrolase activator NlpD